MAVVDDHLRQDHHQETIGLLLCSDRNEQTVRYSLGRFTSPMAIAGMKYNELPENAQQALPGEQALIELVTDTLKETLET